jgi:hypothetical protein
MWHLRTVPITIRDINGAPLTCSLGDPSSPSQWNVAYDSGGVITSHDGLPSGSYPACSLWGQALGASEAQGPAPNLTQMNMVKPRKENVSISD